MPSLCSSGLLGRAWLLGLVLLGGCDDGPAPAPGLPEPAPASASLPGAAFDPASTGTVLGRVTWAGTPPTVAPFRSPISPLSQGPPMPARDWPNPNAPAVDATTGGLRGAVVALRGVDLRRAGPWHHAGVTVVAENLAFAVRQGDRVGHVGFVPRGGAVTWRSDQDEFEAVQVRGGSFFSVPLLGRASQPEARTLSRTLRQAGVAELQSGAGHFWMRAYLFVSEHPYLAQTGSAGEFILRDVPAGDYDLVCWHPDWRVARRELDADTALTSQVQFRPAIEVLRRVSVKPGQPTTADFVISLTSLLAG